MSVSSAVQSLGLLGPGAIVDPKQNQDPAKYPTLVPTSLLPPGPQRIVMPGTGTGAVAGTGPGASLGEISPDEFAAALDNIQGFEQISDGDVDDTPLEEVGPLSFNMASALFTALGLAFPPFSLLSIPFTVARGYDYFFGEDDDVDTTALDAWGIDPTGTLGGLGGPPGLDDTTEVTGPPTATQAAISMANTEALTDPASASGDGAPAGGSPGDPGGGVGEDSEAVGDPDSDSGDDDDGSGDSGGGGGDSGGDDGDAGDDDYALGGLLSGSGPKDITAHGGEYIIRKSAVDKYGPDLFNLLNKGLLSAS